MNALDILREFSSRPRLAAHALPDLDAEQLNAHPAGHPNSIAWLLWHAAREIDVQLAELTGKDQVWSAQGFGTRFGLPDSDDDFGLGHTPEQARKIHVEDQGLLVAYLDAVCAALDAYTEGLAEDDLDEFIDHRWDPPVTRGVRLVSLVDDAIQHVGQAYHVAGALSDTPVGPA
ncbi:DinB family protein [Corynebacterium frankenforstense]|uniref:mycothiol transferase n=1 Tax=Corynebacterium frankenforstense TaxID=1230998 RepID=UPI0026ED5817|nr:DinB family protein [Corynebacterium frankenforstense]